MVLLLYLIHLYLLNSEIATELEDKIKGNTVLVEEILMNPDQQIPEEEK